MGHDRRTDQVSRAGRGLTWVGWIAAVAAGFGLGALVVMDVHATFASPILLGEFYGLVLALTCVAMVIASGALLARWAAGWIRAEISGLRTEIAALRDKQAGYADGVVHGMALASDAAGRRTGGGGSVTALRRVADPPVPPSRHTVDS